MQTDFYRLFESTVEGYRKALLCEARKCSWGVFESIAGKLFDYVESVEMSAVGKRFLRISIPVVSVLLILIAAIYKTQFDVNAAIIKIRELAILGALGCGSFELFFFFNFRTYKLTKEKFHARRRALFIKNIESDFMEKKLYCTNNPPVPFPRESGVNGEMTYS